MLIKFNRARLVRLGDTVFVESNRVTLSEVMKCNPNIMFHQGISDNSNTIILKTNINPSSMETYIDKTLYFAAYTSFDWLSFISSHKDTVKDDVKKSYVDTDTAYNEFKQILREEAAREAIRRHQAKVQIKRVIYHDPATIIFWTDGSKTVVKCGERDTYDPEKGLAMCIVKKWFGNEGNYYNKFYKWLPKEEP